MPKAARFGDAHPNKHRPAAWDHRLHTQRPASLRTSGNRPKHITLTWLRIIIFPSKFTLYSKSTPHTRRKHTPQHTGNIHTTCFACINSLSFLPVSWGRRRSPGLLLIGVLFLQGGETEPAAWELLRDPSHPTCGSFVALATAQNQWG